MRVVNSRVHNSSLLELNIVEDCSLNTAILQKSDVDTAGTILYFLLSFLGASVATFGVVEGSVLCPTVHVERHGKVFDSIIGPGSGVAEVWYRILSIFYIMSSGGGHGVFGRPLRRLPSSSTTNSVFLACR